MHVVSKVVIPYNDDIDQPQHLHCLNRVFYLQQPCKKYIIWQAAVHVFEWIFFSKVYICIIRVNFAAFYNGSQNSHIFCAHIFRFIQCRPTNFTWKYKTNMWLRAGNKAVNSFHIKQKIKKKFNARKKKYHWIFVGVTTSVLTVK